MAVPIFAAPLVTVLDEMNMQAADLESLSRVVKDTLAFLRVKEGTSAFEFGDGAYHVHQLAKELAYLLLQQVKKLKREKEVKLNASGFGDLIRAISQVEAWLATWDIPPEKHPNIVVRGDVDHDFQSWLKTSLASLNTEEAHRLIPRTRDYQEAVIAEAMALAVSYRIYADIANRQRTKRQPGWRFW